MKHGYDFPMAGNTVTMVLYNVEENEVLLGLRKKDSDAFPDCWSIPGGYLNVGTETLLQAASRETKEEIGLDIDTEYWVLFFVDDKIGADPRYVQVINVCYTMTVNDTEYNTVVASDDLQEVKWVELNEAMNIDLPFNHNEILEEFYSFIAHEYELN